MIPGIPVALSIILMILVSLSAIILAIFLIYMLPGAVRAVLGMLRGSSTVAEGRFGPTP